MSVGAIRAVLFDSGDTLLAPVGGVWLPSPAMRDLLNQSASAVEPDRLTAALDRGMEFLDTHHQVATEEDEVAQFREYHSIVLGELGLDANSETLENLARVRTEQVLFPEVRAELEELRSAGFKLGIVSNAWPSLERIYRSLGLRDFFDAFVISSRLGCLKPDPRIYRVAIEQIAVEPESILFVDNDAEYVRAAESLGMRGVVMCRYGTRDRSADMVTNLAELRSKISADDFGTPKK